MNENISKVSSSERAMGIGIRYTQVTAAFLKNIIYSIAGIESREQLQVIRPTKCLTGPRIRATIRSVFVVIWFSGFTDVIKLQLAGLGVHSKLEQDTQPLRGTSALSVG